MNRRDVLRKIGIGAAVGVGGVSAMAGNATAWERQDVCFTGCSLAWIVVNEDDVTYEPPTVARVVVGLHDGSTECRDIEFTPENTFQVPGKFGDARVRKVFAGLGEKILGVIMYNYREDRFSSASCIFTNEHWCAKTPWTPSLDDASCVQEAREIGGYDCETLCDDDDHKLLGLGKGPGHDPKTGLPEKWVKQEGSSSKHR
ncbi:hypothetical protein Huta_0466 [Halorhabdus utahensis DSM 12940]|uniref:Uncharacterized protein n=2 Tax=Halorhabdus utahensis TaxID=146826 RepID=C7NS46_HALUD|nr:hypothetical protein Huta_0466 [Halorhabdus utahensis DSM 12940]